MKKEQQMQQEFLQRYDEIIESQDQTQMERLGSMTKRVMRWLIREEPQLAETAMRMLDDSDTATTQNYLTEQESRQIVERMQPRPTWTAEALKKSLSSLGLPLDNPTLFNEWSLLTVMLMIQSDSGETLRDFTGFQPNDDQMLRLVYRLALDKLKDQDGVFNVRRYFGLE